MGVLSRFQGHDRDSISVPFPMLGLPMGFVDEVKLRGAGFLRHKTVFKISGSPPTALRSE